MPRFTGIIAGPGHVDGERSVLVYTIGPNSSDTLGISADAARYLADSLLRAANEIDPLENDNAEV